MLAAGNSQCEYSGVPQLLSAEAYHADIVGNPVPFSSMGLSLFRVNPVAVGVGRGPEASQDKSR